MGLHHAVFAGPFVLVFFLYKADVKVRVAQGQQNGGRNIDGGGRANDHAHQHGKGKIVNDAAAEEEQGQGGQKGRAAGQDGAAVLAAGGRNAVMPSLSRRKRNFVKEMFDTPRNFPHT